MRKRTPLKSILFLILQLACGCLQAQDTFQYKASLGEVKQSGFYKISLSPEWVAHSKSDFSDIRIAGEKGNFIPYIVKTDLPEFYTQQFLEFPLLRNQALKDSNSEVVIENVQGQALHSLLLIIKNYSAYRTANLSGSDDQEKWYVIKEHLLLQEAAEDNPSGEYIQSLSFPLCQYRFFKVTINDKGGLPVKVLKAGIFTNTHTYGKYLPLPAPIFQQKDSSDKNTYITLSFGDEYQVDRLQFEVLAPILYKRSLTVLDAIHSYPKILSEFSLTPGDQVFSIPTIKTNKLRIMIDNRDDQLLQIKEIQCYQINHYLLAYLEEGKRYSMLTGDSIARRPEYDLKYFTDTLKGSLQEIMPGPIEIQKSAPLQKDKSPGPHNNIYIWIVIVTILILLISLSSSLLKAISKKTPNDSI